MTAFCQHDLAKYVQ